MALNPISTTYTAQGTINPADTLSVINCTGPVTMTLAAPADTHEIIVSNIGAFPAWVTTTPGVGSRGDPTTTLFLEPFAGLKRIIYQASLAFFTVKKS